MTIQRGIRCKSCSEDIFSNSVHDFVTCKCGAVYIDGGFDYMRVGALSRGEFEPVSRITPRRLDPHFRDEKKVKLAR